VIGPKKKQEKDPSSESEPVASAKSTAFPGNAGQKRANVPENVLALPECLGYIVCAFVALYRLAVVKRSRDQNRGLFLCPPSGNTENS
jgi:hypothetical protein